MDMDTATVSTPARQSLGTRPAVTPTQSAKKDEDERRRRRTSGPRAVGTDAQQATPDLTKGNGPNYPRGFQPGREGSDGAKLPVYMFLQQGVLEEGVQEHCTAGVHARVARWWSSNADSNEDRAFTGNCTSTGKILAAVVKVGVGQEWSSYMCRRYLHSDSRGMLADLYNPRQDEDLACYYGLKKSFSGRSTTWVLSRSSLARERADAQWSFCLPAGWAEEYGADGSWKFKTSKGGTPVSDILEMRFAHIRAGMGCHKAPTASQAAQAGMHGDTCRLSHGERRRNSSRSGGQPFDIQQGATLRVALPVNAEERGEVVRAATWRNADHVFETRSV
ncbi:unnamed protein product [Pylaiella littoralis]